MASDDSGIRPETAALDALIQASVRRAQGSAGGVPANTMLFLGNRHEAFPTLVVCDPVLEPVDKLVWMAIMLQARESAAQTAFPNYEYLASKANVASTSTIARAIAILRLTRWLTLCARVRASSGRYSGNVYVLHDEPIPLIDALHLDADYMQFLEQSQTHHHARVRKVAHAVLEAMGENIQAGTEVGAPVPPLERRAQAAKHPVQREERGGAPRHFLDYTPAVLDRLRNAPSGSTPPDDDQDQNSKADDFIKVGSCCSSNTVITTTTTTQNTDSKPMASVMGADHLIHPNQLNSNQRGLAEQYLKRVAPHSRQAVLDEFAGRLDAEARGAKPLYDQMRFLFSLCKAAENGTFVPNLGLKVAEARGSRAAEPPQSTPPPPSEKSPEDRQREQATAHQHLAAMRASLQVPSSE